VPENSESGRENLAETRNSENDPRKVRQNAATLHKPETRGFAKNEWWWKQISANQSPAKFPDIREFTGKSASFRAISRLSRPIFAPIQAVKRMKRRYLSGNLLLGIRENHAAVQRKFEIAMSVDERRS